MTSFSSGSGSDDYAINDMVTPGDLVGLNGAPFTQTEVDTAVAVLRATAGWHIAPIHQDTIVLDILRFQRLIRLPTKALISVDEIRDTTTDPATVISNTSYSVSINQAKVHRHGCWPHGYDALEVDLTHGYDIVPQDLLPVIAEAATMTRRDQTGKQYGAGPYSVTFDDGASIGGALSTKTTLDRYLLWQPGMV